MEGKNKEELAFYNEKLVVGNSLRVGCSRRKHRNKEPAHYFQGTHMYEVIMS